MSEPWYLMIQQAELWRLKTNAGPDAYEKVAWHPHEVLTGSKCLIVQTISDSKNR